MPEHPCAVMQSFSTPCLQGELHNVNHSTDTLKGNNTIQFLSDSVQTQC